jgi:hypothetical protein
MNAGRDHGDVDMHEPDTEGFDFSTPEGQEALRQASRLLFELREEYVKQASRKIALYERTLGLAVIPVLVRRAAITLLREADRRRK